MVMGLLVFTVNQWRNSMTFEQTMLYIDNWLNDPANDKAKYVLKRRMLTQLKQQMLEAKAEYRANSWLLPHDVPTLMRVADYIMSFV